MQMRERERKDIILKVLSHLPRLHHFAFTNFDFRTATGGRTTPEPDPTAAFFTTGRGGKGSASTTCVDDPGTSPLRNDPSGCREAEMRVVAVVLLGEGSGFSFAAGSGAETTGGA